MAKDLESFAEKEIVDDSGSFSLERVMLRFFGGCVFF